MKIAKIIFILLCLLFAFYTPDNLVYAKLIKIICMAIFIYFLMRLMLKVPSKKDDYEQ
jgi:hypothetical protein